MSLCLTIINEVRPLVNLIGRIDVVATTLSSWVTHHNVCAFGETVQILAVIFTHRHIPASSFFIVNLFHTSTTFSGSHPVSSWFAYPRGLQTTRVSPIM